MTTKERDYPKPKIYRLTLGDIMHERHLYTPNQQEEPRKVLENPWKHDPRAALGSRKP